jgi:hypothetical protein
MSGAFDKREKGFESKWAHDQDLKFKLYARRNKLLGVWAAGLLGLSGTAVDAYAKEVVASDFEKPGDDDVFAKVRADLDAKRITLSDHLLRKKMEDLLDEAKNQIETESRK